jgi:alpha-tubulin suppressor-like RCC1 family protein
MSTRLNTNSSTRSSSREVHRTRSTPQEIIKISAGFFHNLILLRNGQVWSFGGGESGQLGLGPMITTVDVPTMIPGIHSAVAVSAGESHSLILLNNGDVLSFGKSRSGQLGHGRSSNLHIPTLIPDLHTAIAIAAGAAHSLVLLRNHQVLSFGQNDSGQLGLGYTHNVLNPIVILSVHTAVAISAGGSHSLVLLRNGQVLSFGIGNSGQLGKGNTNNENLPTAIPNLNTAIAISAGGGFSVVLLRNGQVLSFGNGEFGQLGIGHDGGNDNDLYVPTAIPNIHTAAAISTGEAHTLVLLRNGQVLSFGSGDFGQLGQEEETEAQYAPTTIPGINSAAAVAAGGEHSLILLSNGQLLAFGYGALGQLGQGNEMSLNTPASITFPSDHVFSLDESLNPTEAFDLLMHEDVNTNSLLTDLERILFIVVPVIGPRSAFIFDRDVLVQMAADTENYFYPCRGFEQYPTANAPTFVKISLTTNFFVLLSNLQTVTRPNQRSRIFYIVPSLRPGTTEQKSLEFTCSWSACRSPEPDYVGRAHCQAGSNVLISKLEICQARDARECLQSAAVKRTL